MSRLSALVTTIGVALLGVALTNVLTVLELSVAIVAVMMIATYLIRYANEEVLPVETPGGLSELIRLRSDEEKKAAAVDYRTTHQGHLYDMWKRRVSPKDKPMAMFLTGATGYVGRAVLLELLNLIDATSEKEDKNVKDHKIYITVRAKSKRRESPTSAFGRAQKLREDPIFKDVQKAWDDHVVVVETGDMREPNCDMSEETMDMLKKANITHIIHSAADVRFDVPFAEIAGSNITVSLTLKKFAEEWNVDGFVYVSTAFVSPREGTDEDPIQEKLIDLKQYKAMDLYDSMRGDTTLAAQAKEELGFVNNYVFSKCVCEHLLQTDAKMPTSIVRPSIVGPSAALPYPGWNGDGPSTVTAFMMAVRVGLIKGFHKSSCKLPVIPVDIVCNSVLHALIETGNHECDVDGAKDGMVLNCRWFVDVVDPVLCLWAACSVWSKTRIALQVGFIRFIQMYPRSCGVMSWILNRLPLYALNVVETFTGAKTAQRGLKWLDLIKAYQAFMDREFHWQSSVRIPDSFEEQDYLFRGVMRAVEHFLPNSMRSIGSDVETKFEDILAYVDLAPDTRFDIWWAMTIPNANFFHRVLSFCAVKYVRMDCKKHQACWDLRKLASLTDSASDNVPLCLAPEHRNFFDFMLLNFICSSVPLLKGRHPTWSQFFLGNEVVGTQSNTPEIVEIMSMLKSIVGKESEEDKLTKLKLGAGSDRDLSRSATSSESISSDDGDDAADE